MSNVETVPSVIASAVVERAELERKMKAHAERVKEYRAELIASLPVATSEQLAAVVVAAREVHVTSDVAEVAGGLNRDFQLNEFQKDQLAAAKAQHRVEVNKPEVRAQIVDLLGRETTYVRSFKLRATKQGRMGITVSGLL